MKMGKGRGSSLHYPAFLAIVFVCYAMAVVIFKGWMNELDEDELRPSGTPGTSFSSHSRMVYQRSHPPNKGRSYPTELKELKILASEPDSRDSMERRMWVETVRRSPRIFIIHNLATPEECDKLIELGKEKGMKKALITPYGQHELVESSTRTNTQAWLDFQQDDLVARIEKDLGTITRTSAEHGENLQILHYKDGSQQFKDHHDYFDPATDPPENFRDGGNRMATAVLYLNEVEEGGETEFTKLDLKLTAKQGDAILFYDMKPKCDGTDPDCVEQLTEHAGRPPTKGEKWVATKWIHERPYQYDSSQEGCFDMHPKCKEWSRSDPSECTLNRKWMQNNCRFSCEVCSKD